MDCGDPLLNLTNLHMQYQSGSPPNNTKYLSNIWIVCSPPFYFSDGTDRHDITCTSSSYWSSIIPPCICMNQKFSIVSDFLGNDKNKIWSENNVSMCTIFKIDTPPPVYSSCGGNFTDTEEGTVWFTYFGTYANNMNCQWRIYPPSSTNKVENIETKVLYFNFDK